MRSPTSGARAIAFLAMAGLALGVAASDPLSTNAVQFGARTLKVPAPANFEPTSKSFPQLLELMEGYQPATNRIIDIYVDPTNFAALQSGEAEGLDPYFQLSTLKNSDGVVLSASDFTRQMAQAEDDIRKGIERAAEQIESQVARGNERAKSEHGVDVGLGIKPPKFLGTHRKEPWGVFISISSMVSSQDEHGETTTTPMISSVAIVLVNHQLMYLSSYRNGAGAGALQWTRKALDAWVAEVRAANPDEPGLERNAKKFGLDWSKFLKGAGPAAAKGALIGMSIFIGLALLAWLSHRRRRN